MTNPETGSPGFSAERQIRLVVVSAAIQAIFYLRGILVLPVLSRTLGPELFGVWSKMQALSNLAVPILGLGVAMGLARYLPGAPVADRGRFFGTAAAALLATGVIATAVLVAAHPLLAPLLYQAAPALLTPAHLGLLGTLTVVAAISQVSASYYRLVDRPLTYGGVILSQVFLLVGGIVFCAALLGADLWVPLVGWSLGPALASVWVIWRIARAASLAVDSMTLRKMVAYGLPLVPATLVTWVIDFADRYLITWLVPRGADELVGIYGANCSLAGLVTMVYAPFFLFYTPTVARLWDGGNVADVARLTRQSAKFATLFALPVVVIASVVGSQGVAWIAGDGFRADAALLVSIMSGLCLYMLGAFAQTPLLMANKAMLALGLSAVTALVNVGLGCLLIPLPGPWGGLQGAALATLGSYALFLMLNLRLARRLCGTAVSGGPLVLLGLLAGGSALILHGAGAESVAGWVGAAALAAAFYVGGVGVFGLVTREELGVIGVALTGFMRQR